MYKDLATMSSNFLVYALNYLFYALALAQKYVILWFKGWDVIDLRVVLGRIVRAAFVQMLKMRR